MDEFLGRVYLSEIKSQCEFVCQAALHVNRALQGLPAQVEAVDSNLAHRELFRGLHSLLTHAANVSKLLWPQKAAAVRGTTLRAMLSLPETDHPLANRRLRNHLDHFDERLDQWAQSSGNRIIVNDYVGPLAGAGGMSQSEIMRHFDPSSNDFTFQGEPVNIQVLVSATEQLLSKVKNLLASRVALLDAMSRAAN